MSGYKKPITIASLKPYECLHRRVFFELTSNKTSLDEIRKSLTELLGPYLNQYFDFSNIRTLKGQYAAINEVLSYVDNDGWGFGEEPLHLSELSSNVGRVFRLGEYFASVTRHCDAVLKAERSAEALDIKQSFARSASSSAILFDVSGGTPSPGSSISARSKSEPKSPSTSPEVSPGLA